MAEDFQLCLDFLNSYNGGDVPPRSPHRLKRGVASEGSQPHKSDADPILDDGSSDFAIESDHSARNSVFSRSEKGHTKSSPSLDDATCAMFLEEVSMQSEVCSVDDVITISKYHDQWDPKKVAFVVV